MWTFKLFINDGLKLEIRSEWAHSCFDAFYNQIKVKPNKDKVICEVVNPKGNIVANFFLAAREE